MDVIATLIEITAFDPVANANVVGRITNRNDPRATRANDQSWLPILATAPSVGTSVFNGAFTGAGAIDLSNFVITLADGLGDAFTRLMWAGADIKIYAGNMQTGNYPLIFRAVGEDATRTGRLELSVSLTTRESLLFGNLLSQSYAGTGNLEGDSGLKGTMKPWVFGSARFCRPVLLDPVRQIYQVSAYGPVEGITNVFEGGQEIQAGSDYTGSLTDFLTGPGPAQGTWTRMNQYGLFRLGSQPLYQITCHVKGDTNAVVGGTALTKVGDIIGRILALTTTMSIKASSLAALNAAITQPFDDYFDAQMSVSEVLTKFLLSVGGYYTFDESGNLIFGLVRFGQSSLNLDGLNRTEPTVVGINALPVSAPVWYLRLGAEQCHFVHDASNLPAVIADQTSLIEAAQNTADAKNKTFPTSPTPPTGAVDGDQWPDSSVSPTTMRRFSSDTGTWVATSNNITTANQVPYSNGTSLEALRPSQANADTTSLNTAASITGQGSLATLSSLANGGSYLTGFGDLSSLNNLFFGSSALLESSGGALATLNAFKTALGIASGFSGQGALATLSSLANGGSYLTGFGGLSSLSSLFFGSSALTETNGGTPASLNAFKTALGIASAISGQGSFATLSSAAYGSSLLTGFGALAPLGSLTFGGSYLLESAGTPATNANYKTALGTASAISGQGAFATINSAGYGSSLLTGFGALSPLSSLFFGSSALTETSGGAAATLNAFKTALGISSGFTGQGSFATKSSADYGTEVTGTAKPDTYRVSARGNGTTGTNLPTGFQTGLWRGDGTGIKTTAARSYSVCWYDRSAKTWSSQSFDIYGSTTDYGLGTGVNNTGYEGMATYLNGIANGSPVVVYTHDEPRLNRLSGNLPAAMYRCGASRSTFGGNWFSQGAYILIGVAGAGEGNGIETFEDGGVNSSTKSYVEASFYMIDGRVQARGKTLRSADDLLYADGVRVGALKPGEVGANVTENRTAAAFTGQGALATLSSLANGGSYLTGFGALSSLANINFGSANLLETSGGAQATLANFKTSAGTAAAISGQGSFATLSSAAYGSSLLTGFGSLSPLSSLTFGGSYLLESAGVVATNANYKTSSGTAAAIAGQGALATASTIGNDSQLSGSIAGRLTPYPSDSNYLLANRVAWAGGFTVESLKPGEAGANVTETRTAGAISGQGPWATTPRSVISMVSPNSNAFPYPRPLLNGQQPYDYGWASYSPQGAAPTPVAYNNEVDRYGGPIYVAARNTGGAAQEVVYYLDIPWAPGKPATVSAFGYSDGFQVRIEAINAAKNQTLAANDEIGTSDGRYYAKVLNPPTGTAFIRCFVRCLWPASSTYQNIVWWGVKLEYGTVMTPYNEDAARVYGADTMAYGNGALVNNLRPGEAGANVTEGRTAAAITGQGSFATISTAAYGSSLLTGFGSLAPRGDVYFGNSMIKEASGGATATLANFKTANGTAAAIVGQSSWATYTALSTSTVEGRTQFLQTDGYLQSTAVYKSGIGLLSDYFPATTGADKTSGQTAAGIAGQGALATASTISGDGQLSGQIANRLQGSPADSNYLNSSRVAWNGGDTLEAWKPQEKSANKTEGRTAAAITSQGPWATTTRSVESVAAPNANSFPYPRPLLNGQQPYGYGWQSYSPQGAAPTPYVYNSEVDRYGGSLYVAERANGGSAQEVVYYYDVPWGPGKPAMASTFGYAPGFEVRLNALNSAKEFLLDHSAQGVDSGRTWARMDNTPANTAYMRVIIRCLWPAASVYQNVIWWGVKLEFGTSMTPYSEDAGRIQGADKVAYGNGALVNNLRPQEAGANITENRTAGAISGQSAWATYTGLSTQTVESRTSKLQQDGYLESAWVFKNNYGFLNDYFPATQGSDKTGNATAAAISGQSAWATYTGLATQTVEQRTQKLQTDGFMEAGGIYKANQGLLSNYFPQEAGSNVTENRASAGIAGQGAFATVSSIARSNVASYFNFNAFSLNYTVTRADGTSIVTESLAITNQGVSAGFSGQGSLATMSTVGTDQINANSVTVPGYSTIDNGGSLNNYTSNVWQDFDTATGGGSVGGGGGGGNGGGGWSPQVPQQN